jgi:hypothetical protein
MVPFAKLMPAFGVCLASAGVMYYVVNVQRAFGGALPRALLSETLPVAPPRCATPPPRPARVRWLRRAGDTAAPRGRGVACYAGTPALGPARVLLTAVARCSARMPLPRRLHPEHVQREVGGGHQGGDEGAEARGRAGDGACLTCP